MGKDKTTEFSFGCVFWPFNSFHTRQRGGEGEREGNGYSQTCLKRHRIPDGKFGQLSSGLTSKMYLSYLIYFTITKVYFLWFLKNNFQGVNFSEWVEFKKKKSVVLRPKNCSKDRDLLFYRRFWNTISRNKNTIFHRSELSHYAYQLFHARNY